MMKNRIQHKTTLISGFTLVEVLIAVLVLSIGLLGLASLQASSLRNNYSAYMRSQAAILAHDMADRIRSNPTAAAVLAGPYSNITASPATDTGCASSACNPTDVATHDAFQWFQNLATLPGGTGTVIGNGINFTVTVMWDDEKRGVTGTGCSGDLTVDLACFAITFML